MAALNCNNILQPTCNVSSFLRPSTANTTNASFISASHVLARNLKAPCPTSLLKALHEDFVDRSSWHNSYMEEKHDLIANDTYVKISLQEHCRLCRLPKGVPKTISSMCIIKLKRDEHLTSDRAKSRIVVLGNLENCTWQKSEKFAPVFQYSSFRLFTSMAVENCQRLKQGDCNNAFCNARLPDDETTIIKPPSGDPDAKKDVFWLLQKALYGLARSPRH